MDTNNVVIAGDSVLANKIQVLVAKSGLAVAVTSSNFAGSDIIIEALTASTADRKQILTLAGKQASEKAILATTSPVYITELAAETKNPERFAGLHFTFNPIQDKFLVQIVSCLETSAETINVCKQFVEKIGGTAVIVQDSPGLIVDRVMALLINEAATMYAAGLAGIEDIDRITRLCLNWPMGPFEFADAIGIDNVVATLDVLSQSGYQIIPCRILKGMVAMGKLGKKTGKGFYTYNQ